MADATATAGDITADLKLNLAAGSVNAQTTFGNVVFPPPPPGFTDPSNPGLETPVGKVSNVGLIAIASIVIIGAIALIYFLRK